MADSRFRLHGLEALSSQHGLDVRATVLRVATDLFCQTSVHPPSDFQRYTELALALLPVVDATTRGAVAQKLARTAHAPERVLQALLGDADAAVAGEVLTQSPGLSTRDLAARLADCGPAEAAAIARRADLDPAILAALADHSHLLVVEALLENKAAPLDAAATARLAARCSQHPPFAALLFAHPHADATALPALYASAPPAVRARIREDLAAESGPPPVIGIEALVELNDAVAALNRSRIGAALVKALRLDAAGIHRVLEDETGETYALALSAAGIKRAPAINVLLVTAPDAVRTSVACIFAAADVYESTPRRVAQKIVSAVAGERPAAARGFEPHMHPSGTPHRLAAVRRRSFAQRPAASRTDIAEQN